MAVTVTPLGLGGSLKVIRDADIDETLEVNINDGAATIYAIDIDNAANGAATYVKFWNVAVEQGTGAVTLGTTAPDMILMVPASVRRVFAFVGGLTFSTGITVAAVTAGGTAGVTGPTSAVVLNVVVG